MSSAYRDLLVRLGDELAAQLTALWPLVEDGSLAPDEFVQLAANLIEIANAQGGAAAWLAFRGWLETATGAPHRVAAPIRTPEAAVAARRAVEGALSTILASELDTAMQLERLARNSPVQAATDALDDAMKSTSRVSGWRRGLEPGACEMCIWWWRDGRVFRAEHSMPRHPGCTCHQIPVLNEQTDNFQTAEQAGRRR